MLPGVGYLFYASKKCIPKRVFKTNPVHSHLFDISEHYLVFHFSTISISWEYDPDTTVLKLEEYEKLRPPRRSHFEMVLPRDVRQKMLKQEWDVTQMQIAASVRANVKIKNQRRATVNNLGKATKMEEVMENAGRKVLRGLLMKKSTRKQLEELEHQMNEADKARHRHQMERMEVAVEDLATDAMEEEEE